MAGCGALGGLEATAVGLDHRKFDVAAAPEFRSATPSADQIRSAECEARGPPATSPHFRTTGRAACWILSAARWRRRRSRSPPRPGPAPPGNTTAPSERTLATRPETAPATNRSAARSGCSRASPLRTVSRIRQQGIRHARSNRRLTAAASPAAPSLSRRLTNHGRRSRGRRPLSTRASGSSRS